MKIYIIIGTRGYFAQTVRNARKEEKNKNLVIFAGACQSYYEALINAGGKLCIFSSKDINRLS